MTDQSTTQQVTEVSNAVVEATKSSDALAQAGSQLLGTFNELIVSTSGAIKNTASFAGDQIPDLIHQLLLWKTCEAGISFFVASIIVFFGVRNMKRQWAQACLNETLPRDQRKDNMFTDKSNEGHPCCVVYLLLIIPIIIACNNFYELLQLIVAPKIWLIEYAANLVKH